MKKIFFTIFIMFIFNNAFNQSLTQEVNATTGGYFVGANSILSWTLGEVITETFTNSNGTLTQGFQQSSYNLVTIKNTNVNYKTTVFPNLSNGIFTISITGISNIIELNIINLQGQEVYKEQLNTTPNYTKQLDISNYPKGIYFLKLTGEDFVRVEKVIIQ